MSAVEILRQNISRKGKRGFGRQKTDGWIGLDLQADSFVNAIVDISEAINQDPRGLC